MWRAWRVPSKCGIVPEAESPFAMPALPEHTVSSTTVYDGRILRLDIVDIRLDNGRTSRREIVRHGPAAVILAQAPDGRFVFVRQFRKPMEDVVLEAIAGGMEPGETPEECARRETAEETGYAVESLVPLGPLVCSPGYCTEVIHAFFATLKPGPSTQRLDADENIDAVLLPRGEVEDAIANGTLWDGKTLAAWAKLRVYEERSRP